MPGRFWSAVTFAVIASLCTMHSVTPNAVARVTQPTILYDRCPCPGGSFDVFLMDADGTNVRPLADTQDNEFDADWSPDGTRVVYTHTDPGWTRRSIIIYSLDTGKTVNIPIDKLEGFQSPVWSPDGSRIAFQASDPNDPDALTKYGIYILNLETNAVHKSASIGFQWESISWSPDGRRIVFYQSASDDLFVADANVVNGIPVNLTNTGQAVSERSPAWSPDGTEIAFVERTGGHLWVMDSNGANPRRLTDLASFAIFGASWSPDSQEILFGYWFKGDGRIHSIRRDGTQLRTIGKKDSALRRIPRLFDPAFLTVLPKDLKTTKWGELKRQRQ